MGRNRNNPGSKGGKPQPFNPNKNKNINKKDSQKQNDPMRKSSKSNIEPKSIALIEPPKTNKSQDSTKLIQTKSMDQKITPLVSQPKVVPSPLKSKTTCDAQKCSQVK